MQPMRPQMDFPRRRHPSEVPPVQDPELERAEDDPIRLPQVRVCLEEPHGISQQMPGMPLGDLGQGHVQAEMFQMRTQMDSERGYRPRSREDLPVMQIQEVERAAERHSLPQMREAVRAQEIRESLSCLPGVRGF